MVLNRLFMEQPGAIAIDTHATLFQSMHGAAATEVTIDVETSIRASDVARRARGDASSAPSSAPLETGVVVTARNTLTGSRPVVFHFNGGAKGEGDRCWSEGGEGK